MHHSGASIKTKENCHAHRIMYCVHIIPKAKCRCSNYEKYSIATSMGKLSDKIYVWVFMMSCHSVYEGDLNVTMQLTYMQN